MEKTRARAHDTLFLPYSLFLCRESLIPPRHLVETAHFARTPHLCMGTRAERGFPPLSEQRGKGTTRNIPMRLLEHNVSQLSPRLHTHTHAHMFICCIILQAVRIIVLQRRIMLFVRSRLRYYCYSNINLRAHALSGQR